MRISLEIHYFHLSLLLFSRLPLPHSIHSSAFVNFDSIFLRRRRAFCFLAFCFLVGAGAGVVGSEEPKEVCVTGGAVGTGVGGGVGAIIGVRVGASVGTDVGSKLGKAVGALDGVRVGFELGKVVGALDGVRVPVLGAGVGDG